MLLWNMPKRNMPPENLSRHYTISSRAVPQDLWTHPDFSKREAILWKCRQLVIGTGTGALPVMDEVKREAKRRKIKLVILPTAEAIRTLQEAPEQTNAILHVTC